MIKNKKQMFIIIGAFVLTLLLGSTTYAFFNYTRTGSSNNIRVGRISFVSKNEETITLNNLFPIDPSNTSDMNDSTKVGTYSIDIKGDTDYVDGIEYLVSATDANIYTNQGQIVPITLDFTVTGLGTSNANYFTAREAKNANIYKKLVGDTLVGDGMLLVGYIKPNTTSGTAEGVDGNITIKAYLDKNKILISDTYDGTESDNMGTPNSMAEGKTVLTTTEWNSLQSSELSFKIKVEANEGIWVIGSLEEIMRKSTVMDNINSEYVNNNTPGINFGNISGDENGKGVYTLSSTANEKYPIMYYRGDVKDNNVIFGDKCWKTVRTTETGGVKLLYNGNLTNTYEVGEILDKSDYNNVVTPFSLFAFDSSDKTWSYRMEQQMVTFFFSLPASNNYSFIITGSAPSDGWDLSLYKNETHIYHSSDYFSEEINESETLGRVVSTDVFSVEFYLDYMPADDLVIKIQVLNNGVPLNQEDYTIINDELVFDNNSKRWVNQLEGLRSSRMEFSFKENGNYLIVLNTTEIDNYYVTINGIYSPTISDLGVVKLENIKTTDKIMFVFAPYNADADPVSFYAASAKFVTNGCENDGYDTSIDVNDINWFAFNDFVPGGVGYMHGEIKNIGQGGKTINAYYGSGFTWDGTNYKLVDPVTTLDNYHHYTCNLTTADGTCSTIRYFFYNKYSAPYYFDITNGDGIEEVLEELYTNTYDSNAKSVIDTWYSNNMISYTNRLEDTIWCNDRSMGAGNNNGFIPNGGDLNIELRYGPLQRGNSSSNPDTKNKPSLECINKNDRFTVNNSNGNRALTYPVALLTSDEMVLAGEVSSFANYMTYLYENITQWTLSPYNSFPTKSQNFASSYDGNLYGTESYDENIFHPAISIKPGQLITKGIGTDTDPYVIE